MDIIRAVNARRIAGLFLLLVVSPALGDADSRTGNSGGAVCIRRLSPPALGPGPPATHPAASPVPGAVEASPGEVVGWLYFRARMYDPETGRFLSRDPVWDAGNVGGWYTFVGNGPVSGRDPFGRQARLDRGFGPGVNSGDSGPSAAPPQAWAQRWNELDEAAAKRKTWVDKVQDAVTEDFVTMEKGYLASMSECRSGSKVAGVTLLVGVLFMAADTATDVATLGGKKVVKEGAEEVAEVALKQVLKQGTEAATETAAKQTVKESEYLVNLYHGSRKWEGDKFDLDAAARNRTETHLTSKDPAVFLTDDPRRAITQYAGKDDAGRVVQAQVPKNVADEMRQVDPHGRLEFAAKTKEQVEVLNQAPPPRVMTTREALMEWSKGNLRQNYRREP